jgi:hypothetical protein
MKRRFSCHYLFFLTLLLLTPHLSYGQSDIFEVRTPNALIIFDTSSSMNMGTDGASISAHSACIDSNGKLQTTNQGHPPCDKGYTSYSFEGGGNHPDSKLYQAKQALREVIKDIENVNIGFATYGQRKQEKWRGYYQKWGIVTYGQPKKDWCEKRYWRWRQIINSIDGPRSANDFASDSFKDAWGFVRSGITKGSRFYRTINLYDKANSSIPPHSNLKTKSYDWYYTVTDIKFNAEYGWYTYTYISDPLTYDTYEEAIKSLDPCTSCSSDKENDPFPVTWPDGGNPPWQTYFKNDSRGSAYQNEYDNPYGNDPGKKNWWNCNTKSQPKKDDVWGWVKQWRTYSGTSKDVCKDQADGWLYISSCYDVSEYYYPIGSSPALSYDPTNRPHTWSYFKIDADTWPVSIQHSPYYPAPTANPGDQDNHYFFINFPQIDDSLNGYATRNKIVQWLDTVPVKNMETGRWHTKLPLKASSITSNTIESFYTPLADSLYQAKKYFNDYIYTYNGGDSASKVNCRGNYIILMTDGLESARCLPTGTNCPSSGGSPDYDAAANAANDLFKLVLDKDGKPAGVKTFVIGFGAGLKGNKPEVLDNIAKNGGTEHYNKKTGETEYAYFAENINDLKDAFKEIFQAIGTGYGRSNPVVSSTRDRIYRGYFDLPGYKGHLAAFDLNTDGSIKSQAWDAGDIMNTNGRGNVYTWAGDQFEPDRVDFKVGNSENLKEKGNYLLNPSPEEDLNWDSINHIIGDGKIDKEDSEAVINFVLDASYGKYESGGLWAPFSYQGKRSVTSNPPYPPDPPTCWKLGDIYHSTPLLVGKPPLNIPDDQFPKKYSDFKTKWKDRETIIYVGANDGMLHAFDNNGKEKFSIIPRNLLGKLRDIRNDHKFYVDSSPRAYDVYFKKGKKKDQWKTIVVSGERGGGNYYFAIDVTDPGDPQMLWEKTDPGMGNTWSRPEIGRAKINGEEKFVAFVGGGYSTTDNVGNTFYIIDVEDGTIVKSFVVGDKANKVPAGATAFDKDLDGRIDSVYFGDIQGTLWKIKIVGEKVDDWKLIKLFTSDGSNPIFYPPAVTKNNQGKVLVYFGQGDELNLFENVKDYYFYEISDPETDIDNSGVKNWGIKLPNKGEKVLAAPSVGNNVVYFTTWQYTGIENNCGAGAGRLYGLTSTTAGAEGGLAALVYNLKGERLKDPTLSLDLGIGIPSAPIVIPGRIYISTSLNANNIISIPIPSWGKGRLKYWREVF